ncbi:hypothetical protein [Streptomyces sp. NPDC058664]|uniref:hypothetical protein n=1 Tax=unclassified Streptomyces TaxID=2593676 RepID=UPI003660C9E1
MKKYLLAAAGVVAAAVMAAPSAVGASTESSPGTATGSSTVAARAEAAPVEAAPVKATPVKAVAPAPSPVRTVRPGERVDAGQGYTVWLTREGRHWTGPDGYENVRSVVDGNIDRSRPGVSHQSEGDATGVFHSGLYYGTRDAGRVELTGAGGRRTVATLLELPDRPGWGVWYAATGPEDMEAGPALYDRAGRLLAELPG